jgi:hypothetical protein
MKRFDVSSRFSSHLSEGAILLPELAPLLPQFGHPGCRGFVGPVPPPLSMSIPELRFPISLVSLPCAENDCQLGRRKWRPLPGASQRCSGRLQGVDHLLGDLNAG